MSKFRKRPVVIEAFQWHGEEVLPYKRHEVPQGASMSFMTPRHYYLEIPTLEGTIYADEEDWIITGIKGEVYPCKPDIFRMTYEPVIE